MHTISIIIPVYNEADYIQQVLEHLIDTANLANIAQIIVVDGGSTDGTTKLIRSLGLNITLLYGPKGRAKQMNFGAKHAKGSILYFLHADSLPPNRYDRYIINAVKNGKLAGCFKMKFNSNHWWLRLAGWFTQFNWRACRGGDQSQYITKSLFNTIGGYNEDYIIYEDNILITALYKRKQFTVLPATLTTSARLYKKVGVFKLQYLFLHIYIKRWFGASAKELYTYYKTYIKGI